MERALAVDDLYPSLNDPPNRFEFTAPSVRRVGVRERRLRRELDRAGLRIAVQREDRHGWRIAPANVRTFLMVFARSAVLGGHHPYTSLICALKYWPGECADLRPAHISGGTPV